MTPHPKGTTLFLGSASWSRIVEKCPVCQGTTTVLVKAVGAPDETGQQHECKFCEHAERDGMPTGHVVADYRWKPVVTQITVEGVEIKDLGVPEIRYLFNVTSCSNNSVRHEDSYTSHAEALKHAEARAAECAANPAQSRLEANPSWSVGYLKELLVSERNSIRNSESRIAYAERLLRLKSTKKKARKK